MYYCQRQEDIEKMKNISYTITSSDPHHTTISAVDGKFIERIPQLEEQLNVYNSNLVNLAKHIENIETKLDKITEFKHFEDINDVKMNYEIENMRVLAALSSNNNYFNILNARLNYILNAMNELI